MPGARRTHCLACKQKKTHAGQHRYAEITPALPAQWLYGLLRALPGVPGLLAPVALSTSGQGLIPASGNQDHTTSPYAPALIVCAPPRPSHPASRLVTIGPTPLLPRRDGADYTLLPIFGKRNIFAKRD
jgi:hypothetical protein